jgi:hypothetical protein
LAEKKESSERTKTNKPNAQDKEEADRRRAQKALDISSTLLAIAILIFLFFVWLPTTFGAQAVFATNPLVFIVYFALLAIGCMNEVRVARSRGAIKLIVAGLAIIGIGFVTAIAAGALPMEWRATSLLVFFVAVLAGTVVVAAGGYKAHRTLRQTAGRYGARTLPAFELRNYHYVLAAGVLGAFLLFISSIVTDNFVYAASGFLFLIIIVFIAGLAKTRTDAKRD